MAASNDLGGFISETSDIVKKMTKSADAFHPQLQRSGIQVVLQRMTPSLHALQIHEPSRVYAVAMQLAWRWTLQPLGWTAFVD